MGPVRPGVQACSYYMKTGRCKYGATCKFNHPPNGGHTLLQPPSPPRSPFVSPTRFAERYEPESYDPFASTSPGLRPTAQPAYPPYEPIAGGYRSPIKPASPPSFMYSAQPYSPPASTSPYSYSPMAGPPGPFAPPPPAMDHSRGYAGSVGGWAGARNAFTPNCPTFVSNGSCPEGNKCRFKHPKLSSYPRRPGQPPCRHYLMHQRCDFGNTCKFDHPPPGGNGKPLISTLDAGLYPNRPGQPDCRFYMKHGTCQFGLTCKFNHPPREEQVEQQFNQQPQEEPNPNVGIASAPADPPLRIQE